MEYAEIIRNLLNSLRWHEKNETQLQGCKAKHVEDFPAKRSEEMEQKTHRHADKRRDNFSTQVMRLAALPAHFGADRLLVEITNHRLLSMTLQHCCNSFVIIWRSPASHVCVKEFLFRAQTVPAIKAQEP